MNTPDSLKIQRLVDGECDEAELRSLLIDAEKQPDGWRKIATAFVEDKFWQTQFRQIGTCDFDTLGAPPNEELDGLQQSLNRESKSVRLRSFDPRSIRWLTMAASLMLAGLFGYLIGTGPIQTSNDPLPLATNGHEPAPNSVADLASPNTKAPKITPAILKPDYHMQLPESTQAANGMAFDSEIPLYYVQSPEQLNQIEEPKHDQFQLAPEELVQLANRGIQMRQDLNFISGNLKDGRSFMIPVRTINFSPTQ